MAEFLKKKAGPDSTRTQFNVEEVVYFEDKDFFDCEFKVRMRTNEKDTTGEMAATISKDFSQVTRKW
ncbi:hypothetical protein GCM10011511_14500 [Puia dinghuensis]|uniref:Uncharacterized protein n=2 Tax=Puia dinghuensis TaxID=1792502 RepID=A0A8J2UB41_9BACT|nr:hypothetical protein GCM10011511_14500 [Puia dinghuensis]